MKETGSKIAVLIIVFAMLFLASVLFEATNDPLEVTDEGLIRQGTYEDSMKKNETEVSKLEFGEYVYSEEIFSKTPASVDYSTHPLAKNFESIIESTYKIVGVNFANNFSVISWSCGLECQNSVIIDVETGVIVNYGIISATGLSYSPTSRLLVINPNDHIKDSDESSTTPATDYYLIDLEGELSLIAKEVNGENLIDECLVATTTATNILTNETSVFKSACAVPYGWKIISE